MKIVFTVSGFIIMVVSLFTMIDVAFTGYEQDINRMRWLLIFTMLGFLTMLIGINHKTKKEIAEFERDLAEAIKAEERKALREKMKQWDKEM
jgi:nitrate reductase gamma subunit